ncbi:MAG: aminotransferase class I/II-fold pyridoxal phosphate-dependent enzyme [Planctomycetaceae bacterium]|nr:aminotransferase class I/II-fold pyridoxal phosphate-dependent enzyme [Planctomycetaceae bacterium]
MPPVLSDFARSLSAETAFTVLAAAKRLKAAGKDVVELEIGDSPFESPAAAKAAGVEAIRGNQTRYCPSPGLPEFREAAATFVRNEFGIPAETKNIVVAPGAKPFEQFFCEAFLNPGDGVLIFSPHFPTYPPNVHRRGARCVFASLSQSRDFRPDPAAVEHFLANDPSPKAVFLNSPHNPTGGAATETDLAAIADLIRGRNVAVFSDEPYCHMVWRGRHHSILSQPGMLDQSMAAYTFSKSYSMSGWRLGFAVCSEQIAERVGVMINTALSCVPPFVQLAGLAALKEGKTERDAAMAAFQGKIERLVAGLNRIDGFRTIAPTATFYAFPNVATICNRLGITSHGLAMYLLEGADDAFGVACLGGECFGDAGQGFLRFSCAECDERIDAALAFLPKAIERTDRVASYLETRPTYRLSKPYPVEH